ncbi:MAG: carboxypeptidase-like regulatory domain-containing protein [Bacteroidetes bacterium]|nr:carboxypeptidase-like regulatory domain-containing protein [Bacteroidota bacterium]HET6243741.1 carboxypeptidase-like regulatory domain-containing protein [Bacteroidia bacterium]
MKCLLPFVFFLPFFVHSINAQSFVSGVISDKKTGERLPYATVVIKNNLTGASSNQNGEFDILIPADIKGDSLIVSYLGYHNFVLFLNQVKSPLLIKMEPQSFGLNEFIVRPQPPTHYIKLALSKVEQNYPSKPFQTESYYREEVLENKKFIKDTEAIFHTYYPNYQDTVSNQHQLILHRQGDTKSIDFLQDMVEKKRAKKKKEAQKKGEEIKENEEKGININFGGPETILKMDFIKDKLPFLDSLQFKKFNYAFGGVSAYQEKELLIIDFESKRVVEHEKQKGKIFLDADSYAIVSIEYHSDFVVPLAVRPLLFMMGYEIIDPVMEKKFSFYENSGKWYPKHFQWNMNAQLIKKHMFKKNENSTFTIEQVLSINKINTDKIVPIPEKKRFNTALKFEEQVHNDKHATWSGVNIR